MDPITLAAIAAGTNEILQGVTNVWHTKRKDNAVQRRVTVI